MKDTRKEKKNNNLYTNKQTKKRDDNIDDDMLHFFNKKTNIEAKGKFECYICYFDRWSPDEPQGKMLLKT